jgi:hypothetical protein
MAAVSGLRSTPRRPAATVALAVAAVVALIRLVVRAQPVKGLVAKLA